MKKCTHCKKEKITLEIATCKFCNKIHCLTHIIPESHNCSGLIKYKEKKHPKVEGWKDTPLYMSDFRELSGFSKLAKIRERRQNYSFGGYDQDIASVTLNKRKVPFYKPVRTSELEDGYSSRVGIHEVLKVTPTIKDMIIRGTSQDEMEVQGKKEGMMTMLEDGVFQAVLGITTLEEVFRVVSE